MKVRIAIFLIWLFHVSAMIGMTLGHESWFLSKTPLNLAISALIFVFIYPLDTKKKFGFFGLFFIIGMFVEWLGVNYSLLFGSYEYGQNLGIKLDGVPIFIGVYWALLAFITAEITTIFVKRFWAKALLAALLMLVLDIFMEQCAPRFDFWSFGEYVPLSNFITWFAVALVLQILLLTAKITGNRLIALNLYLAQLVFFIYFTIIGG